MSDQDLQTIGDAQQRDRALARWANEGGSGQCGRETDLASDRIEVEMPAIGDTQIGLLHIRVIALENLVIALLATASGPQLALARDMARIIEPRSDAAPHPLTIRAAARLTDLIERSERFQSGERPQAKDGE
ncbi:hypothetical protein CLV80_101419 [Yoonia maritima]|uniref:Uncharacterized protein n=1 Tax=Yoonia maritima TaxID=1435347 RepID=A0A2T0W504_9RHOB|nr:hypothetical protein [Yoonia maritima]PRY80564.1 hypothetical protein CLV80_101419 [Yoonia maritima]